MITAKDLDIIVPTNKRPLLLQDTLNSILKQSVQGFALTVLDNSNDDETQKIIAPFEKKGVRYIRTFPSGTPFVNFFEAQKYASKKYVITFHDDDLMHPQYIQRVLEVINKFGNVSIVTCKCTSFYGDKLRAFPNNLKRKAIVLDTKAELAAYMYAYGKGGANTPGTVYTTQYFKTASVLSEFHKNFDWPFTIEGMDSGKAVIIDDKYCVLSRMHRGQDTHDASDNGTELPHLFAWISYFAGYLRHNDEKSPYYKVYRVYAYNLLKGLYHYLKPSQKAKYSWPDVLAEAKKRGFIDDIGIAKGNYRKNVFKRISTFPYRAANKLDISKNIKSF